MKVGLMMVIRNEDERIEECLKYHTHYFDGIVIVDQESDDQTQQRVKLFINKFRLKYPDKQIQLWIDENWGHCEPSRKVAGNILQAIDMDWAVYLDPDEKLPIEFLDSMHAWADLIEFDGFKLKRENSFDVQVYDESIQVEPKWLHVKHPVIEEQFRMFRLSAAQYPDGLHTRIRVRDKNGNESIKSLPYVIEHRKKLTEMWDDLHRYKQIRNRK